ncbi:MAG: DNA repair exonuclease [Clostridia bacterium]|nr:DNA repair exonuclease [Clostridia bacterium]
MILVQFGDLHLDQPLENLSPERARAQRENSRKLLFQIVDLAVRENADAIICTGDLFDSEKPYLDSCIFAAKAFGKTDIPVFIAPGNHDPYSPSSLYEAVDWPANVHIFTSSAPQTLTFPAFRITGWANTEHRSSLRPLEGFRVEKKADIPEILVFHGEIAPDSPYFSADGAQIAASQADYLALGHIHGAFQKKFGSCLAVMNGGVEATRRGETGEKGVILANIGPEGAKAKLIPLGGCRAFEAELEDRGEETVISELLRLCPHPPENTMVTLTLLGDVISDKNRLFELAGEFLSFKLTDRRKPEKHSRSGKSLAALFAKRAEEEELSALALEFGLCALENREQPTKDTNKQKNSL